MQSKQVSMLALFIALSVIGSAIKIPAFIGSIALDVFPALLAACLLGKRQGALIAGVGHLVSAFLGGMPLGPMHVVIALEMTLLVWVFGAMYQSGKRQLAGIVFVLAVLAPLPMIALLGTSFYIVVVPSLFVGSLFNVVIALLFIPKLVEVFDSRLAGITK
ncbi:ECF transporter S component [Virgibacillus ihumii]|uniref:ECF transporter S component n=1 Tax=Virgibacillus ihumii TaxID=2686091 RepID=UPI00157C98F5|nr:ECF transporter S component [Virgibacillus ihumii]